MKFCPKCGSLMIARRENGKLVYICPRCGYREEATQNAAVKILSTTIKHSEKERLVVITEDTKLEERLLPKVKIQCPRCGNDEAYYWVVQTRRADEPPTRFYKCTRCGYVWREYD